MIANTAKHFANEGLAAVLKSKLNANLDNARRKMMERMEAQIITSQIKKMQNI